MKKIIVGLLATAGMVSASMGVEYIAYNAIGNYSDGELTSTRADWGQVAGTGTNAFLVAGGALDTYAYTNVGSYVFYNTGLSTYANEAFEGSMLFSLSASVHEDTTNGVATFKDGQTFFDLGISVGGRKFETGGDVFLSLCTVGKSGDLQVRMNGKGDHVLASLSEADLGWDPTNALAPALTSGPIKLNYEIRRSTTPGFYTARAELIANNTTSVLDNAQSWQIGPRFGLDTNTVNFVIGRNEDASNDSSSSLIDMSIGALSLAQNSNEKIALVTPVLDYTARDRTNEVQWSVVADADAYLLYAKSSTDPDFGLVNTMVGGINATNTIDFVHGGLINLEEYEYYLVATSYVAGVESVVTDTQVFIPMLPARGTIFDLDFDNVASGGDDYYAYDAGSIVGQSLWRGATNSLTDAFVIEDGALVTPASDDIDQEDGNDIYWLNLMNNDIGNVWTGKVSFTLSTKINPEALVTRDIPVSNEVTGVVDTQTVERATAGLSTAELFNLGLTCKPKSGLVEGGKDDVTIVAQVKSSGSLEFKLNSVKGNERVLASLSPSAIGWDPMWKEDTTTGADTNSSLIEMQWEIRKTAVSNVYIARTSFLVDGASVEADGTPFDSVDWPTYDGASDLWEDEQVWFGFGIDEEADDGDLDGVKITNHATRVTIESMSLNLGENQNPFIKKPQAFQWFVGNKEVTLSWDGVVENDGYLVRRYETFDQVEVEGDLWTTNLESLVTSVVCDQLENYTSYFYTVEALYTADGAPAVSGETTPRLAARPRVVTNVDRFGPISGQIEIDQKGRVLYGKRSSPIDKIDPSPGGGSLTNYVDATWLSKFKGAGMPAGTTRWYATYQVYEGRDISRGKKNDIMGNKQYGWRFLSSQVKDANKVSYMPDSYTHTNGVVSALVYLEHDPVNMDALNDDGEPDEYSFECFIDIKKTWEPVEKDVYVALRQGGEWFVSEEKIDDNTVSVVADLANLSWAKLDVAKVGTSELMTVTNSYSKRTFTAVDAFGFFADTVRGATMGYMKLSFGPPLPAYTLWADKNLIFNEKGAPWANPDLDGRNNLEEWALGGDPNDPDDIGFGAARFDMSVDGNNIIYVHPKLTELKGPTYVVKTTSSLTAGWQDAVVSDVQESQETFGSNEKESVYVTNTIPMSADTAFFGLEIQYDEVQ